MFVRTKNRIEKPNTRLKIFLTSTYSFFYINVVVANIKHIERKREREREAKKNGERKYT